MGGAPAFRAQGPGGQSVLQCVWQLCVAEDHPTHDGGGLMGSRGLGFYPQRGLRGTCVLQPGRLGAASGFNSAPAERSHLERGTTTRPLVRLRFPLSGRPSPSLALLGFLLHAVKIPQGV